mmetsp:Transcript_58004/g.66826  ORF Transcript_58004/g.66826 Transcript_58004/m.66826 type:complete len:278 (+) Transcript_58004:109-942(+)
MSTFKNTFAVLKEINDKKKTIVITDKPKGKKPVKAAKADAPVVEKAAPAVVAAVPAKAAKTATKAAPAPAVNEPPKNSLAEMKEKIKRAKAEEAAKAAAPVVEETVEETPVEVPVAEETPAVEGEAPVEGEAAAETPAPAPEVPKYTLAEYQKLREERLFVVKKEARRVDPTSVTGLVALNADPAKPAVKKVAEPAKKPAAPVKAPVHAKGVKVTALPTPAPAPKTAPKDKKEKTLSLGEFVAQAPAGRNFRPRRHFNNEKTATAFNAEDAKQFPSL